MFYKYGDNIVPDAIHVINPLNDSSNITIISQVNIFIKKRGFNITKKSQIWGICFRWEW